MGESNGEQADEEKSGNITGKIDENDWNCADGQHDKAALYEM